MKKIFIMILVLCCFSQLVACSSVGQLNALKDRILAEDLQPSVNIERKLLIDDSGCKIYVPWVTEEQYIHINEKIEAYIIDFIFETLGDDWSDDNFLEIDYTITYNRNGILSFYFTRMSFQYLRPHQGIMGVNIDLLYGNFISITSLIDIDENFLENLFLYQKDEFDREKYVMAYLMDIYGEELILENIRSGIHSFYFSQDYIYISFALPQALGFHLEMGISWEQTVVPAA